MLFAAVLALAFRAISSVLLLQPHLGINFRLPVYSLHLSAELKRKLVAKATSYFIAQTPTDRM
jgi:hypothetical protein